MGFYVAMHYAKDEGSESSSSSLHEIPMEMDLTASGPPISDDETELETRERKYITYAKRILPHVGLVCLLFSYLLIGATIFHAIEGPNELLQRDIELTTIFGLRDDFQNHIWNITQDVDNRISREAFNSINQEYFEQLVRNIFISYRNQFINENHLTNKTKGGGLLWTFPNSIFFATTVITTIGYGNLVPTTTSGRIACIIFALFGIPLLLVTIADIGKFLSEFLSFLYKSYRAFKRKVRNSLPKIIFSIRKQSRRISHHYRSTSHSHASDTGSSKVIFIISHLGIIIVILMYFHNRQAGSLNLHDMDSDSESSMEDELRIPVFMVLFVLLAYTAIGGFLFQVRFMSLERRKTFLKNLGEIIPGFGDIVPTEQVYMFFTMAYIIFGLSLATMCIDLAGTEYIRKIHYLGSKMEDAKGAVISGLQVGEHILKHTGIEVIKTAGGKLVQVRGAVLNSKQARELGVDYILADLQYQQKNILYEPLSPNVAKLVKENNIKILPDDITEKDGYIVQNKSYDKPALAEKGYVRISGNIIHRIMVPTINVKAINMSSRFGSLHEALTLCNYPQLKKTIKKVANNRHFSF
uniref:Ion_trans_2 domain-containing protein n=1 Tax=Heterorhabditis bacteriophora TaxID=37862 RepID=A0A1I7X7W0_HETBA